MHCLLLSLIALPRHIELVDQRSQPVQQEHTVTTVTDIEDIYELSPLQAGMLFHSLYAPASGVYVVQFLCKVRGNFDGTRFQRAFNQVMQQHPVLRTSFHWKELDKPLQVVHQQVLLPCTQHDWRGLSSDAQALRLTSYLDEDRRGGFDLDQAPLMRLAVIRLDDALYQLVLSYHHLLLDGWSWSIILQELLTAYAQNDAAAAAPYHLPYRDYIAWLHQQDLSQAELFWRQYLKGFATPTQLQVGTPAQSTHDQADAYAEQQLILTADTSAALRSFAQQQRLTLNTLVQGAWALLLHHYSGANDIVFGVTVAGRPIDLAGVETTVGPCINTLPLRVRLPATSFLLPWLRALQEQQLQTRQYEYTPLPQVQQWSELPPSQALFESIVIFENYASGDLAELDMAGIAIEAIDNREQTNYPLTLMVEPGPQCQLRLFYHSQRFDSATISQLLGHLHFLLTNIIANPHQRLGQLARVSPLEQQLVADWNATAQRYAPDCVQQLFEQQVARTPDAPAVEYAGTRLSYRELNERANQLAHHLRSLGVGPEVLVGLCVERSLEMLVGVLGILKAGGAYVPLDPAYPAERLVLILDDARVAVFLTQQTIDVAAFSASAGTALPGQIVYLDGDWSQIATQPTTNPPAMTSGANLAYVIYTSGSTGRPKGVAIEHAALNNFLHTMTETPGICSDDVLLAVTTLSFDIAGLELYLPLITGARLVIASQELAADGFRLRDLMASAGVTIMQATPSTWRLLLEAGWAGDPRLKLLCGGEALPRDLADRLHERVGLLWNMYGPTETTIWSLTDRVQPSPAPVLIGRPIANTQVYILDEQLRLVPVGVPGQLYIGGTGVARGYRNRPDLTAERFVPNPFAQPGAAGSRLYKTGDLARWRPDGRIEYLGRLDFQVKLRGFRIELGEIEVRLRQHPAVRAAVVAARPNSQGEPQLVAYAVLANNPELPSPSPTELQHYLAQTLPSYMVPAAFVFLEELPLTPNGKIDRNALPAPEGNRATLDSAFVAPQTPLEQVLASEWAAILGMTPIGLHDNFFEMGGNSLAAMRLISSLSNTFEVDIDLRSLFAAPSVAKMAALLLSDAEASARIERTAELLLELAQLSDDEVEAMMSEASEMV